MSQFSIFGSQPVVPEPDSGRTEHVVLRRALSRVLEFTGRTIDDVVNCPVARNHVTAFYRLHRWVERQSEITELERQWNRLPL